MTSPLTNMLLFEVFRWGELADSGIAEQVKVFIKTEYGALHVTVTDEGNLVLDAVDGNGEVLQTACLNPHEFIKLENENAVDV